MARLRSRIAAALSALRGSQAIISSTVTPYESGMEQRREPMQARQLLNRYAKWVKVAASRKAAAVASVPCRWYREKGSKSAFRGARVGGKSLAKRMQGWGPRAVKSIDYLGGEDNVEEIVDPMFPGNMLFERAWPGGSWFELMELTELHLSITGNAYWAKILGPNQWPIELWPLNPQDVTIVPDDTNLIREYIYGREQTNEKRYAPETMLHFRRPNPKSNPYYGLGDLAACVTDSDVSQMMSDFTLATMEQGGHPSAILTLPASVTADQASEIEARINQKWVGVSKAGRVWVLRATDADLKLMDSGTGKEKPYLQSEAQVRDVIANCFDMPVAMLTLENAALATAKVAAPLWQLYGIRPAVRRIEDVMNEYLVPDFRKAMNDESLFVAFDNCVDEDEQANTDRGVKLYQGGLATRNESRAAAGMEPTEEGGDEFAGTAEPIEPEDDGEADAIDPADEGAARTIAADPAADVQATALNGAQVTAMADMVAQSAAQQIPFESVKPMMLAAFPLVPERIIDQIIAPLRTFEPKQPETDQQVEKMVDDAKSRSIKSLARFVWSSKWTRHEAKDRRDNPPVGKVEETRLALAEAFRDAQGLAAVLAQNPGSIPEAFASIALEARIMEALTPGLEEMLTGGYNTGAADVRGRANVDPFNLASPDARRFLDNYRIRSVRTVLDTVESQVRTTIQTGLDKGTTLDELTTEVGGVLDGYATYGSERIARTETARAYMHGRERAWQNSGVVTAKEWLLSSDPCPLCGAMAQKYNRVDLGKPFVPLGGSVTDTQGIVHRMDYSSVQGPPVHPNCRCTLGAVFSGE